MPFSCSNRTTVTTHHSQNHSFNTFWYPGTPQWYTTKKTRQRVVLIAWDRQTYWVSLNDPKCLQMSPNVSKCFHFACRRRATTFHFNSLNSHEFIDIHFNHLNSIKFTLMHFCLSLSLSLSWESQSIIKSHSWESQSWESQSWESQSWESQSWESQLWESQSWEGQSWESQSWESQSWNHIKRQKNIKNHRKLSNIVKQRQKRKKHIKKRQKRKKRKIR